VMDEVTTEMCQSLNDRIIEVGRAYDHARGALELSDPEDIKYHAPFLTSDAGRVGYEDREGSFNVIARREDDGSWRHVVPDDQLVEHGIGMPPYHFKCRTETVLE
jgi:hypothetical protein